MAVNASEASEIDTSGLTDSSQSRGTTKYRASSTPVETRARTTPHVTALRWGQGGRSSGRAALTIGPF